MLIIEAVRPLSLLADVLVEAWLTSPWHFLASSQSL
jgi:hypothetical protein